MDHSVSPYCRVSSVDVCRYWRYLMTHAVSLPLTEPKNKELDKGLSEVPKEGYSSYRRLDRTERRPCYLMLK